MRIIAYELALLFFRLFCLHQPSESCLSVSVPIVFETWVRSAVAWVCDNQCLQRTSCLFVGSGYAAFNQHPNPILLATR